MLESLFYTVACLRTATLLKKRLWHRCFSVNFVKFQRTPFLQKSSGRLLMNKPLFAPNVLGLTLVLCIVFVMTFFLGSILKGFRILKSGNSVLGSELSEEVLKLCSITYAVDATFYK